MNIVEEIHNEVKTAYLKEVAELELKVDAYHKKDEADSRKLKLLGFGFKKFASEKEKEEKELAYQKEVEATKYRLETIKAYKLKYPYRKFIPAELVGPIVDKYRLVIAPPDRFIGEMPESNLNDMANFNYEIPSGDGVINYHTKLSVDCPQMDEVHKKLMHFLNHDLSSKVFIDGDQEEVVGIIEQIKKSRSERSSTEIKLKPFYTTECGKFKLKITISRTTGQLDYSLYPFDNSQYKCVVEITESRFSYAPDPKLLIIGTPDQFHIGPNEEIRGGQIKEKVIFESSTVELDFKDPIVLFPVEFGFIVITAWGDEKNIPGVFNSSEN